MGVEASNGPVTLVIMLAIAYAANLAVRWVAKEDGSISRSMQKAVATTCIVIGATLFGVVAIATLDGRVGLPPDDLIWPAFFAVVLIAFGINVFWWPWRPFK
jgi:hypothetical protein